MESHFCSNHNELLPQLTQWRRWLHQHPETGFDLTETLPYVENLLKEMGLNPHRCGKSGVIAVIQGKQPGRHTLLRADMDALPILEDTTLPFRSENGRMHACGHDMHTAMLLGAAKLLSDHSAQLSGVVTVMFQPAEEILEGARDMLNSGLLNDRPDQALALHVMTGGSLPTGTVLLPVPGTAAPGAVFFIISLTGRSCHGASPWLGVDPLPAAAHLILGLQTIPSRENPPSTQLTLTIGSVAGGSSPNVIPDQITIQGTIRAICDKALRRAALRMREMASQISRAFGCYGKVEFTSGCPPLLIDEELLARSAPLLRRLLGDEKVITPGGKEAESCGSEDFAYISQQVPSLLLTISAGSKEEGYSYSLHHPQSSFHEAVLPIGAKLLAELTVELNASYGG